MVVGAVVGVYVLKKFSTPPAIDLVGDSLSESSVMERHDSHSDNAAAIDNEDRAAPAGESAAMDNGGRVAPAGKSAAMDVLPDSKSALYDAFRKEFRDRLNENDSREASLAMAQALAEKYGNGDPDLTKLLSLEAEWDVRMSHEGRGRTSKEVIDVLELKAKTLGLSEYDAANLVNHRLALKYNDDAPEVERRSSPVREVVAWMEKNAPSEYEVYIERYMDVLDDIIRKGMQYPITFENYPTIEKRTNEVYTAFFEALSQLPDDSKVFTEYFGRARADAQKSIDSDRAAIEEKSHSRPLRAPATSKKEMPASAQDSLPPAPNDLAFEAAALESIRRFGPEKGLIELVRSSAEWRKRLLSDPAEAQRLIEQAQNENENKRKRR